MTTSYTLQEFADHLGVHIQTVRDWIRSGQLAATNVSRNPSSRRPRYRITQKAAEAFEATRTASTQPVRRRSRRKTDYIDYYK